VQVHHTPGDHKTVRIKPGKGKKHFGHYFLIFACRHKYPCYNAALHSASIIFYAKIMHCSIFRQGAFLSQFSSRYHVVEFLGVNIHTVLSHQIRL
jgi:hypothetical protein